MKLFQKLLLAPAALGLMAPVAASAADLNMAGVNQYTSSKDQVTSITQFSDVKPTDWAYQALSNLIERYGCVAGYPNGTYKGGQAMTRYEAAALLNACLDRITEVTDELKRLMKEFEKELAVLKGRVDGLEAKVGELEATQFSTTTKLRADTRWVLGGQTFGGSQVSTRPGGGNQYTNAAGATTALRDALSFNYDVRLNFDTSFTGKDLLRTQLRAGNFADSAFGANPTRITNLDAGFEEGCGTNTDCGDVVAINRLYYKFPVGSNITVVAGARVRQDDMLAVWPSVYTGDKILKLFQFAGAPGANTQVLGAGAGAYWKEGKKGGWSFGLNYVAGEGDVGNPETGGIGNGNSKASGSVQLAYTGKNWNLSGLYTYNNRGVSMRGTPFASSAFSTGFGGTNSFALSGYWQPLKSGWVPSVSAGWGINVSNDIGGTRLDPSTGDSLTTQSWMVGLNWKDAFAKGNVLGMAVGQAPFVTDTYDNDNLGPWDGNYAWEWYYKFQVSDNIAVTPAIFYVSRPQGQATGNDNSFDSFGYLIQTTFKF
jgi:Carbohydrate-selective porin, OprB family/S-layer homology domain